MYKRDEQTRKKISKSLKGRPKTKSHREAISRGITKGHATTKDDCDFYWTDAYRSKMSAIKKAQGSTHTKRSIEKCRIAALKQWRGNAINPTNEHQVPIADGRPDWLKDYI